MGPRQWVSAEKFPSVFLPRAASSVNPKERSPSFTVCGPGPAPWVEREAEAAMTNVLPSPVTE